MIVKKHNAPDGQLILAICDDNLLGKTFTEGEKQLDLSSEFYKGEKMEKEEVMELVKQASILNIAGADSVSLLSPLIENIATIDSIPHAQVVISTEES